MAKESIALLKGKIDVAELVDVLNAAYAEEWLAYCQYWTAAQLVVGPQRILLQEHFMEHAEEELRHAKMIGTRIIELGGMPLTTPQQWYKAARCVYEAPIENGAVYLIKTIDAAEQCAIKRYQEIGDMTANRDYVTHDLAKAILAEEISHEQDMEDWLSDIRYMRSMVCCKCRTDCNCDFDCGDDCDCGCKDKEEEHKTDN